MEKPLRTLSIDSVGVSREGGECFESNPWKLASIIGNWVGNDPRTKTAGPFQTLEIALTSASLGRIIITPKYSSEGPAKQSHQRAKRQLRGHVSRTS